MKHIFTTLFLISMLGMTSLAQSVYLKGGLNSSNAKVMRGNDISTESLTGFQAGLVGEIGSEIIAFETGVLFSKKGFKVDEEVFFGVVEEDQRYSLNYLEVPVNVKLSFGPDDLQVFVAAGPYVGIALNGKIKYEREVAGVTEEETQNIEFGRDEGEDRLKRVDYGLNIGGGIEISKFQFGVTYGHGLQNLIIDAGDNEQISNRVWQFHIGYELIDK